MAEDGPLWVLNPAGQQAGGGWIDDALRARAEERGMLGAAPLTGEFPRQRVEPVAGGEAAVRALFEARGWTDGLPVVAPTAARVRRMVAAGHRAAGESLGPVDPLRGLATVEKIAVNAVMAGCKPVYFPVVLAAVEALLDPAFNLDGVQTTDENVAPLLVVSGPITERIGMNAGFGCLGPGNAANATIGRALRLVMQNLGGGRAGTVGFAGLGQPGRYTLCLAENAAASPWAPLHVEAGLPEGASAVTLTRAETVINVTGGLEEVASVMGTAASAFQIMWSGIATVILAPATVKALGMGKAEIAAWLHAHGRWPTASWERAWCRTGPIDASRWKPWVLEAAAQGAIPATEKPEDIMIVVAGGDVPIAQQAYCPSWGAPAARITRAIAD